MAEQILKYDLPNAGDWNIAAPMGSRLLGVGYQGDTLRIWLRGDLSDGRKEVVRLHIVQTGSSPPPQANWLIGRAMHGDGSYVVHVFSEEHKRHG